MSKKQLTPKQELQKAALLIEFEQRIREIPEDEGPRNVLDGGGGVFHDLGEEFKRRLKEIEENSDDE